MFAAADVLVPGSKAAEIVLSMPRAELFTTGATVETYRLLRLRWQDFPREQQTEIENRIAEGPPRETFREDADIDKQIDRSRFDLLKYLQLEGIVLGEQALSLLQGISLRHPNWEARPQEQAGFHIWHSGAFQIEGDATKLADVPDELLIATARSAKEQQEFLEGNLWEAFCKTDPNRALRALEKEAEAGRWETWTWRPFLWAIDKLTDNESVDRIARFLLETPREPFLEISDVASWALEQKASQVAEATLWPLWDRIESSAPRDEETELKDALTASLNSRAGHLAAALLKRLSSNAGQGALPLVIESRLNKLMEASGTFGHLARVRLASELSFLYQKAPEWTKEKLVPLFDWSSPDAPGVWNARKYSNYIGSPGLIELIKKPFLELFKRSDSSDDDLRTYGEWLAVMVLANQKHQAGYPISMTEARSALRQASAAGLSSVAHRLAITMQQAKPEDKISVWESVVGPVFQSVWPLDAELQSPTVTFTLIQILRATGQAFPQAADTIIPFIRAEDPTRHTSIYSLWQADDLLYTLAPDKMVDLLAAVVGDAPSKSVFGLAKALERLRGVAPYLSNKRKFQKLVRQATLD